MTVKSFLTKLLAPDMGVKYTFLGRGGKKKAFIKSEFYSVVYSK